MKIIVFLFLFLITFLSNGQIRPDIDNGTTDNEQSSPAQKQIAAHVRSWTMRNNGFFVDSLKMDTLLKYYHNYNPVLKNSITATFTGNYGGAYLNNDFAGRSYGTEFYLFRTHDAYLLTPARLRYYNTTTPYTLLDYSQSENKNRFNESRLNVLHSQNITPKLNVTFRYDQAKSLGQYNYQENKNHFIALYSSYNSEKLNVYGGFIFNRIFNQENGGLANDDDVQSVEQKYLVTKLTDAGSALKNSYLYADAEYKLGITEKNEDEEIFRPVAGISYSFLLSGNLRLFSEGHETDNSSHFSNSWLNQNFSDDSVRFNQVTNLLQINFYESALKKYSFGKRAFAGIELVRNSYAAPGYSEAVFPFYPGDYEGSIYAGPAARWYRKNFANTFAGGGIYRETGKFWNWYLDGRQYVTGNKAGQTELSGNISKPVHVLKDSLATIRISGNLINRTPDYFEQRYFSNRIKWNNDFMNEQNMNASFTFSSPANNLEAGARYSLFNNFIYHDTLGIPGQTKKELLVLSAFADKEFKLGNFNLLLSLLWQKASRPQFIHLPDFSGRLVLSYNMVISKVLYVQLGVDTRYNTAYYADAYHPVTGLFYLQNEKKLGNYPYTDIFANLKLKRTRVFAQYMNAGSLFLNKSGFTALHYPMNQATFRLGIAWSFYD